MMSKNERNETISCSGSDNDNHLTIEQEPHQKMTTSQAHPSFSECLGAYYTNRKQMKELADRLDPDKTAWKWSLPVRLTHSGGIVNEDGTFKGQYRQQCVDGISHVQSLEQLYDAAEHAQPYFRLFLDQMLEDVKEVLVQRDLETLTTTKSLPPVFDEETDDAHLPRLVFPNPPLKGKERAQQKARDDYSLRQPGPGVSWLYDINRATVVCETMEQIRDVVHWVMHHSHVVKVKNRFIKPSLSGYRDILFHIRIPVESGTEMETAFPSSSARDVIKNKNKKRKNKNKHENENDCHIQSCGRHRYYHIVEIQVHHRQLKELGERLASHRKYEYFRNYVLNTIKSLWNRLKEAEDKHKKNKGSKKNDDNKNHSSDSSSHPSDGNHLGHKGEEDEAASLSKVLRSEDMERVWLLARLGEDFDNLDLKLRLELRDLNNSSSLSSYQYSESKRKGGRGFEDDIVGGTGGTGGGGPTPDDDDDERDGYCTTRSTTDTTSSSVKAISRYYEDVGLQLLNSREVWNGHGEASGCRSSSSGGSNSSSSCEHPSMAESYINLGLVYSKLGYFDAAQYNFQKALDKLPKWSPLVKEIRQHIARTARSHHQVHDQCLPSSSSPSSPMPRTQQKEDNHHDDCRRGQKPHRPSLLSSFMTSMARIAGDEGVWSSNRSTCKQVPQQRRSRGQRPPLTTNPSPMSDLMALLANEGNGSLMFLRQGSDASNSNSNSSKSFRRRPSRQQQRPLLRRLHRSHSTIALGRSQSNNTISPRNIINKR